MPEQVGRDDGVVLRQLSQHGPPRIRAVADAMDEEDRRTLSETYICPPVSVDGAELCGVITFPPTARLEADLGGIDWLFDRILRWTCHATRPRTLQGCQLHPGSMTRWYGTEVSASCRRCKRSVTRCEATRLASMSHPFFRKGLAR